MKKHLNIQTVNSAEDLAEGQKKKIYLLSFSSSHRMNYFE